MFVILMFVIFDFADVLNILYYTIYEINKIIQTYLPDIQEYIKRLIQLL